MQRICAITLALLLAGPHGAFAYCHLLDPTCVGGKNDLIERMIGVDCDKAIGRMSSRELDICAGLEHFSRSVDTARAEQEAQAEAERKAAMPHNDPGAVSLCAPPYKMGRDGCQLYRPLETGGK